MKNVVILTLAETLVGLDRARADGIMLTAGSPLVPQVWLMEHLNLFTHLAHFRSPLPYDHLEMHRLFYLADV